MNINISQDGQTLTVHLQGRLDTNTAPQVSETLKSPLSACNRCLFDMAEVDYASSAGLRLLLQLHKQLEGAGGKFSLRNVQPGVRDILAMTGFTSFLHIEDAANPLS